jgi:hypothetical protein
MLKNYELELLIEFENTNKKFLRKKKEISRRGGINNLKLTIEIQNKIKHSTLKIQKLTEQLNNNRKEQREKESRFIIT